MSPEAQRRDPEADATTEETMREVMPDAKPVGPVPPGSTAQEITDLLNHEDPLVPKLVPSPADRKPQESEQQNWGTTGEAKEARPEEPQRQWEQPHPLKPPIPLIPPYGRMVAVEEEPLPPPEPFKPNPADNPENFADMAPEPSIPTEIARRNREAAEEGKGPFRGPYYDFVARMGPYPQGPTFKGLHFAETDEENVDGPPEQPIQKSRVPPNDDQTGGKPAPTTRDLLKTPPVDANDLLTEDVVRRGNTTIPDERKTRAQIDEGDYPPMNPEDEPDPSLPGYPIHREGPAFAGGDPGTGLENIHTEEPPDAIIEPGPEPEPTELTIDSPSEGSTVPPVHDVTGSGAEPDAEVTLHFGDQQVASTTADGDGNWGFTGDTPAATGEVTWEVRSGEASAQVSITVEEGVALSGSGDWAGFRTHAEFDEYLNNRPDLDQPGDWGGMTLAAKRSWLDDNAR